MWQDIFYVQNGTNFRPVEIKPLKHPCQWVSQYKLKLCKLYLNLQDFILNSEF